MDDVHVLLTERIKCTDRVSRWQQWRAMSTPLRHRTPRKYVTLLWCSWKVRRNDRSTWLPCRTTRHLVSWYCASVHNFAFVFVTVTFNKLDASGNLGAWHNKSYCSPKPILLTGCFLLPVLECETCCQLCCIWWLVMCVVSLGICWRHVWIYRTYEVS